MATGIENTLEVIEALQKVADAVGDVLEDGKVSLKDSTVAFQLIGIIKASKSAIEDIKEVPSELLDLDDDEKTQLEEKIQTFVDSLKEIYENIQKAKETEKTETSTEEA